MKQDRMTKSQKDKIHREKYLKNHPWAKHKRFIGSRCQSNPRYNGIIRKVENRISISELKELWFRDKAWLLKRPSIDRINNDGHYEISNCRFIELSENSRISKVTFYKKSLNEPCINGHPKENLFRTKRGWRLCRICQIESNKRYVLRLGAERREKEGAH